MTEICEIGKCHQSAAQQSVLRAKEMFDTLRKNDICEENEAIRKKCVSHSKVCFLIWKLYLEF